MSDAVSRWNSVDVLGDDGMLRYGRVVDVADTGLFFDFLCPKRRHELIPFNRLFLSDQLAAGPLNVYGVAHVFEFRDFCSAVEVLLPGIPAGPWTWFPAELLSLKQFVHETDNMVSHIDFLRTDSPLLQHVAVLRWWESGRCCTDIFPLNRIRYRTPNRWWETIGRSTPTVYSFPGSGPNFSRGPRSVDEWTYTKKCVALPKDGSSVSAEELVKSLNGGLGKWVKDRELQIAFLEAADGCLWYIRRQYTKTADSRFWGAGEQFEKELIGRLSRMVAAIGESGPNQILGDVSVLPVELLLDVFSCLDTQKHTQLGGVCAAWNSILQSPQLTHSIAVKIHGRDSYETYSGFVYSVISPIFKCLRSTTKRIIVATQEGQLTAGGYREIFDLVDFVARCTTDVHLRAIYLVGARFRLMMGATVETCRYTECVWHLSEEQRLKELRKRPNGSQIRLCDFVAMRTGPYDWINLVGCEVELKYFGDDIMGIAPIVLVNVPVGRLRTLDLGCAMWDVLEAALPALSGEETHMLAKWLALLASNRSPSTDLKQIHKMLCAVQTADPRPTSHYRGKKWCMDGLGDSQLGMVSRIAQHFLLEFAKCHCQLIPDDGRLAQDRNFDCVKYFCRKKM